MCAYIRILVTSKTYQCRRASSASHSHHRHHHQGVHHHRHQSLQMPRLTQSWEALRLLLDW
jgi:hypothetical protein